MEGFELILVCENTASRAGILGEHGLCWLLRHREQTLLFDTGQGLALKHNCMELDVDLSKLDAVVLSHGHYDHVKGLPTVLLENDHCPIHAHPAIMAEKYSRAPDGSCKCLSVPLLTDQSVEKSWSHRYRLSREPVEVIADVFTTGYVPRQTPFEDVGGPFYLDRPLSRPDPVEDDLTLYFDTTEGICVILGCAHAGVINILEHIQRLTGHKPIASIFGGMHLLVASPQRLERTIEALRRMGSPRLHPNHCTGVPAIHALSNAFSGNVFPASSGMRWVFEAGAAG